jgi:hypothetical protein
LPDFLTDLIFWPYGPTLPATALDIGELKRGLGIRLLMRCAASKQPVEKASAFFCRWSNSVFGLAHGIVPVPPSFMTRNRCC